MAVAKPEMNFFLLIYPQLTREIDEADLSMFDERETTRVIRIHLKCDKYAKEWYHKNKTQLYRGEGGAQGFKILK